MQRVDSTWVPGLRAWAPRRSAARAVADPSGSRGALLARFVDNGSGMTSQAGRQETTLQILDRRIVRLPSLVVVATLADGSEHRATLGMNPMIVGTGADCQLVVVDPGVSRRHCALTLTARGVLVRDLQSKNGTSVSGVDVLEAIF